MGIFQSLRLHLLVDVGRIYLDFLYGKKKNGLFAPPPSANLIQSLEGSTSGDDGDLLEPGITPSSGWLQELSQNFNWQEEEHNFGLPTNPIPNLEGVASGDDGDLLESEVTPRGGWLQELSQNFNPQEEGHNSHPLVNLIPNLEGLVGRDDEDLPEPEVTLGGGWLQELSQNFNRQEEEHNSCPLANVVPSLEGITDGHDGDLPEPGFTPNGGWLQELPQNFNWQEEEHNSPPHEDLILNLEDIKWQYFANVVVLQLYGLNYVRGGLNLKGLTCLRSLQLYNLRCLESLEGLESLKHLTSFDWQRPSMTHDIPTKTHVVGQFPASLRYLFIVRQCVLSGSNMLARCKNLIKLKLERVEVGVSLDLSNCSSLEGVEIVDIKSLQTLLGLTATGSSKLQTLEIKSIWGIHIPGLDQLGGLVRLHVVRCGSCWEGPCLLSLTKLQTLTISTHAIPAQDCIPHQLQELCYKRWTKSEAPCLNAFKQLQVLDFSGSRSLIQMDGMGDLPTLRSLDLSNCGALERLPNLSKARSLEELNLDDCHGLMLYEEDFEMLATLPLLHPVQFGHGSELNTMRLDIVGRKVLHYLDASLCGPSSWLAWKEGEWQELELGPLPIKIGKRGIWDNLSESLMYQLLNLNMNILVDIESQIEALLAH